jgi:hypothetical protein
MSRLWNWRVSLAKVHTRKRGLACFRTILETFKEHFKAEFVVENQDKLMSELLKKVQKDGVGEYATEMMEYFKMLQLDEKARIRHFVRGLKFGIKELS